MIRFSANLGFLWTDRPLPDAIRAAGNAGFDAVECHTPNEFSPAEVAAALTETGLAMVSLNTATGSQAGDFGLAAVPGREEEARMIIDQAIEYAVAIDCANVSVLAGRTGRTDEAEATYRENLTYAAAKGRDNDRTILIEPLSTGAAGDYHLVSADSAAETIRAIGDDNLRIMLDCFHTCAMHDDLRATLNRVLRYIGHVQISAYPDRGEPTDGEIEYSTLLPWLVRQGYTGPFGAEYNPRGNIDDGLSWLRSWHQERGD